MPNPWFRVVYLVSLFGGLAQPLRAQDLPTDRESRGFGAWATLNGEYYFSGGSFLFAEVNLRSNRQANQPGLIGAAVQRAHVLVGYEQRLTDRWHLGGSLRLAQEPNLNQRFSRVYLGHQGQIGSLEFLKQAGVEQILQRGGGVSGTEGRFSALTALAKNFDLASGRRLRTVLSYEVFTLFQLGPVSPFFNQNKRRIDKTRLKLEAAYQLGAQWSLGLFALHETDYFFAVAQFDQTGQLLKPDRRLNLLAPTVGFRFHYWLKSKDLPKDRRLRGLPY
ncbi:MAG: hypothetical protein MUC97_17855 [Bernardetiaceae bacterium]|nr:hypothetical protein [Bernardetiaceae bacterium]